MASADKVSIFECKQSPFLWIAIQYTWFDHVIIIKLGFRRRQEILRSIHCLIGRWYWKYKSFKTIYFHKLRHIIEFTRINWILLRETFLTHQLHTRTHLHIGSKTLGCHVTLTDFECWSPPLRSLKFVRTTYY